MKKTLFIFSLSITLLILGYQASPVVHAQANPNIGNIGTRSSAPEFLEFIPMAQLSAIEGKSISELQAVGCTEIKPVLKNGVDGGERGVRIFPSQKVFVPTENANSKATNTPLRYFACGIPEAQKLLYGESSPNTIVKLIVSIITLLLAGLDSIATIILNWSGKLLITMLGQGTFIQNDLVKQAWPFVQGIANLGFIFSLLYIALATTLRLESVSSSIQKLLPRLLIGALLVNFSLIIGGLLIDVSRLVMAAEIQLIGGGEVTADNLSVKLIDQAGLYQNVAKFLTTNPIHGVPVPDQSYGWKDLVTAITRSFFIIASAAGMAVLGFGLLERYIALLILLIISPLAYLAVTLPQTSAYAKKWWENFIKWVLYGPIMLFFLIIIVRVQASDIAVVPNTDAILDKGVFQQIVKFIVVIALFFVAATVAKKAGGAGSGTIVNWAQKNPRKALLVGSAVATGGIGGAVGLLAGERLARRGAAGLGNAGRDFSDKFKKDLAARARSGENYLGVPGSGRLAKLVAGPERDDKGKLKKGQSSFGSDAAKTLSKRLGLGDPKTKSESEEIEKLLGTIGLQQGVPSQQHPYGGVVIPSGLEKYINGASLSQGHVTKALGEKNLKVLVEHTDRKSDLAGLAQNEDHLRDIGADGRSQLISNVSKNVNLSENDKADIVNRIVRTVKDKDI